MSAGTAQPVLIKEPRLLKFGCGHSKTVVVADYQYLFVEADGSRRLETREAALARIDANYGRYRLCPTCQRKSDRYHQMF